MIDLDPADRLIHWQLADAAAGLWSPAVVVADAAMSEEHPSGAEVYLAVSGVGRGR
ncbi:hypothetical protein [Nocardia amamiensis]|uniref:hypothetical protein n=1 Tax=Nocardia amamiensis TaxID=404578 RepID=UPI00147244E1|nr:hypothetical protein [Nocardia amamiensis]